MKSLTPFLRVCLIAVLAMMTVISYGQKRVPKIKVSVNGKEVREQSLCFSLGDESGSRTVIPLDIRNPGMFTAKVAWEGTAQSLALILNGPGQTGYSARREGAGPIYLQFKFTRQHLSAGDPWRLSIVNFDRETTATGTVLLYYPVAEEAPAAPSNDSTMEYDVFMELDRSKWGEGKKQLFPDGSFRIDYSNGFYILKKADKNLFFYNADEHILYKIIQYFPIMDVPKADAPPFVDSFTGTEAGNDWLIQFYNWMDGVNDSLLKEIKILLDWDQKMINNYLQLEKNKSVFQILIYRLETIDELRELCQE